MTSVHAVVARTYLGPEPEGDPHVRVSVFAGPDPDHRAHLGVLVARRSESDELIRRLGDPEPRAMGGDQCVAHLHRERVPMERHHVWPLGRGGPDTAANMVWLCANGHGSVHYLLDAELRRGEPLPWPERRRYGLRVRRVAEAGVLAVNERRVVTVDLL